MISVIGAGVMCRCPQCREGPLYAGFLRLNAQCRVCGFDLAAADSGDGPAVFVILIGGALVIAPAFYLQIAKGWSPGATMAFALPLTLVVCLMLLRPFKALLIALQVHNKASQVRNTDIQL